MAIYSLDVANSMKMYADLVAVSREFEESSGDARVDAAKRFAEKKVRLDSEVWDKLGPDVKTFLFQIDQARYEGVLEVEEQVRELLRPERKGQLAARVTS